MSIETSSAFSYYLVHKLLPPRRQIPFPGVSWGGAFWPSLGPAPGLKAVPRLLPLNVSISVVLNLSYKCVRSVLSSTRDASIQ